MICASMSARWCGTPTAKGVRSIVTLRDLGTSIRARTGREEGQTMAEYAIVLGVISTAVIIAFTALSGGITNAVDAARALFP